MANDDQPTSSDHGSDRLDFGEFQGALEIVIGTTILGMRRLNRARHALVARNPALGPPLNSILAEIDKVADPISAGLGQIVTEVASGLSDDVAIELAQVGNALGEIGPRLLKLSGLTQPSPYPRPTSPNDTSEPC